MELLLVLAVVVLFFLVVQQKSRIDQVARSVERLEREANRLAEAGRSQGAVPPAGPASAALGTPASAGVAEERRAPLATTSQPAGGAASPRVTPARPPARREAAPSQPEPAVPPSQPLAVGPAPAPPAVPAVPGPDAVGGPRRAPPPPPPPPGPPRPPAAAGAPTAPAGFDWEGLVGVRLFSAIAGVALVVAAIFFLRYSIEQGWLQPPVRVAIGIAVAVALLAACELKAARRYPVTANALDAAALVILFSTFFAAHVLWNLIGTAMTFALLAVVAALAVLLSVRRDSRIIAVLGLVGGFATPALLSTGEDRPLALFGYLLVLNGGLTWVALGRRWTMLAGLSLALTTLYQWAWVARFLGPAKLGTAAAIFLVFPALYVAAVTVGRRRGAAAPGSETAQHRFERVAQVSLLAPLALAFVWAAVPAYGDRYALLFGFLFCLAAGLLAVAIALGEERLHAWGGTATVLVTITWLGSSYSDAAWPAVLAFVALFVVLYLGAHFVAGALGRPFAGPARHAIHAGPLLLCAFPILAAVEPATAEPALLFGVLLLLLALAGGAAVATGQGLVHYVAAGFAIAAQAVWSSRHLTDARLLPALGIYAVFGAWFLLVPAASRRWGRVLAPPAGSAAVLLASLLLLLFLTGDAVAPHALWGLAILLGVLNVGLFVESLAAGRPWLALVGVVVSWVVLGAWWGRAPLGAVLVPALAVVAGVAMLALAMTVWARGRVGDAPAPELEHGVYLGLAGHVFLLFVAAQPVLAVPPWPLFGVLAVLGLAVTVTALYLRRGDLHAAGVVASVMVVLVWAATAAQAPWPTIAIAAGLLVASLAMGAEPLAIRTALDDRPFAVATVAAALGGQGVAIVAAGQPGAPGAGWLAAAHVALLVLLFWQAQSRAWHRLAVGAVVPAALAVVLWQGAHAASAHWREQLIFALPIYLVALAYPLVVGRAAGDAKAPWQAAVLGSAAFFFEARPALVGGGFGDVIGALPVAQALLLLGLLLHLLRLEPPGARASARLAIVAGAALAFVTVAIPLQLEKEWITVGWALEGLALAWLYGRIPHRGLLATSSALLGVVFVRLALNPQVLVYEPRGTLRIFNWYLYAYLVSAAAMLLAARLLARTEDRLYPGWPRASTWLPTCATVLLFLLLNLEIADYYSTGATITFNFSGTLAQDLTYTLGWGLFAVALLAAGIAVRSHAARVAAIALLLVTVLKAFLHDLGRLGGLYRIGSFVGLAVCLTLVALALQKFVLASREKRP